MLAGVTGPLFDFLIPHFKLSHYPWRTVLGWRRRHQARFGFGVGCLLMSLLVVGEIPWSGREQLDVAVRVVVWAHVAVVVVAWAVAGLSVRFAVRRGWAWVRELAAWIALLSWAVLAGLYLFAEYGPYVDDRTWPRVSPPFWVILGSAGALAGWWLWRGRGFWPWWRRLLTARVVIGAGCLLATIVAVGVTSVVVEPFRLEGGEMIDDYWVLDCDEELRYSALARRYGETEMDLIRRSRDFMQTWDHECDRYVGDHGGEGWHPVVFARSRGVPGCSASPNALTRVEKIGRWRTYFTKTNASWDDFGWISERTGWHETGPYMTIHFRYVAGGRGGEDQRRGARCWAFVAGEHAAGWVAVY